MNDDGQMFVPLHVHTDCSLLDGYQTVQEYCAYVDEHGYVAAAITDHGTCMGHEMFDWEVRSKGYGFKPIFGIEAYLTDDVTNTMSDRPVRDRKGVVKLDKAGMPMFEKQRPKDFNHGCLWAKDQTGLHNLWTLSTLGYTEGFYYKPRIDLKMMREHHEGLFVSDGCMLSQVSRAIVAGDMAREVSHTYKVDPRRTASLLDIFSCVFQGVIPYGAQLVVAASLATQASTTGQTFSAAGLVGSMWYCWILAAFGLLSIFVPFADGVTRKNPWNWEYDCPESEVETKKAALAAEADA